MTSSELNNSNAVEVGDICFETLVPEQMVRLPKYREEIPVQFGVRITNQASTPYRFDLPYFLPAILNPHGKAIQRDLAKNATRLVEESDIPLIMPGESLDFLMDAKFSWYTRDCLRLSGYAIYGGIWIFWNIKPGKYKLSFTYRNMLTKKEMVTLQGKAEIDQFWTGEIMTPSVSLRLR
jgi:hypothetical protein